MLSFKRSSQPRYQNQVSCIAHGVFAIWATREAEKVISWCKYFLVLARLQKICIIFFFPTVIPRGDWSECFLELLLLLLLLSHSSRVWLCDPIDSSPPGSPVPGILQARTVEWVAISFSNAWKWKAKVNLLSRVWLLATPWTAAHQAPPSMRFSRQEYWSGVSLPSLFLALNKCNFS